MFEFQLICLLNIVIVCHRLPIVLKYIRSYTNMYRQTNEILLNLIVSYRIELMMILSTNTRIQSIARKSFQIDHELDSMIHFEHSKKRLDEQYG
jgi:hypothetical protein